MPVRGTPVFAGLGAPASCSSVTTQPNPRGRKLSCRDHWFDLQRQIPCCDFSQRRGAGGRQGRDSGKRAGEENSKDARQALPPAASSPACNVLPGHLHVCPDSLGKWPGKQLREALSASPARWAQARGLATCCLGFVICRMGVMTFMCPNAKRSDCDVICKVQNTNGRSPFICSPYCSLQKL
jgi:hypothetical protein